MNYIVELGKDGNEHELVNSCALYLWQEVLEHDTRFYGSHAHKNALLKLLPNLRINEFEAVHILPRKNGNKLRWIKVYLHEIAAAFRIIRKAKRECVKNIVFLSLSSPTMAFVKKYLKYNPIQAKVFFTLHGDIQWLIQEKLGMSERFFRSLIRKNLSNVCEGNYFVVYGKTIKDKLLTIFPQIDSQLLSLEHPFLTKSNLSKAISDIYRVGAFGVISRHKNSHKIIELAELMQEKNPLIKFRLVGKVIDHLPYKNAAVTVIGGTDFLTRQDYEREIEGTAWLMYLYEDRNYELIASGAFLDAILYQKPIICLRNSFFQHIFTTYEIGIIVDSIEELSEALIKLFLRVDLQEFYALCQANIQRYSRDNDLDKQIDILKMQLKRIYNG